MSTILYYSNFCDNCKQLLQVISRLKEVKNDTHFINIDNRVKRSNGATYVILQNSQEILLPPTVNQVPALLLLNKGHQVLFGNDIMKYLEPKQLVASTQATMSNGEPLAFSLSGGAFGVISDSYSFLDQSADSLSAKGDGGMRQPHHYAGLDFQSNIATPPDNYSPDKVGPVSLEQLQQQRNADIKR